MNNDLPQHAANKVRRALDDVHQLTDDPSEMMRISILAAGVCIGQAAGFMRGMIERDGKDAKTEVIVDEILKLVRTTAVKGADAAWRELTLPQGGS
ncbi:hypothetical protein [Bradyrhizobium sp. SEMIA]|uniref:hypothetical protein n=1 Tax=Bradyrhizobium sp. SEMIA TaxID=2597515 RepID=UPI0018A3CBC5|nr:hypothetical protein [Bradyrhizobium sp. SEMIA]QOG20436.1 hypothetical protein FOM02_26885 [Bradyrhizobium sp. SEMIA]